MKYLILIFFSFLLFPAKSQNYVTKSIKVFGAKGDGKTNDTYAFQKAAEYFNKRGGNGKLIIPKGVYIVGKQTFTGGQANKPAYSGENVLSFTNIKNFKIEGSKGTILKFINGLHIGSFSPTTGQKYDPPKLPFVDISYAAIPGNCISIQNGDGIQISNVEMDGNNPNMITGGIYGDTGFQLQHYGVFIMNSRNIVIDQISAHHFGLDGISVANIKSDLPDNIKITNSSFEYNSRQGFSWVGGNDLYVKNCKFNHSGRSKFSSSPAGGLDIEAESGPIRNGVFDSCEFIDNVGLGMGADSGDSGDCTFKNCTFWGISYYSILINKPNFNFYNCNIYGSAALPYSSADQQNATKFFNCHFEDKPYNGQPTFDRFLVESNNAKYMSFNDCLFITNTKKLFWFQSPGTYTLAEKYHLNNCTIIINNDNLPTDDFIGITRGVVAKNCTFNFTKPAAKQKRYSFGDTNPATNPGSSGTKILYQGK